MPFNGLTTEIGFKVGPVLLETLVKHYLDRLKKSPKGPASTRLKQDELLYHEAFNVLKEFLKSASFHSVEELQAFSNIHTPSPPWTRIIRVIVPMSSCDNAALYLIRALGGEHHARTVVGGTKWWQVRSLDGIEAQWITAKKDWREAKKRHKMQQNAGIGSPILSPSERISPEDSYKYDAAMDDMRCILYLHGGGYFFGSVDQERYSIERYARKINGRVFAIDYRLAPQYPFPCALHDALAAYLYLIDPPPGSDHRPVNPTHVVVAGDSAGGGLTLALLQVLRDTGLPLPAGGVLISPWCDLTHSFPSVHTNTDTDIMPDWGLSQIKPSILWPPPSDEQSRLVQESFRTRVRQVFGQKAARRSTSTIRTARSEHLLPIDIGSTTSVPSLKGETITLMTDSGEELIIKNQIQLYTQNSLLVHPLVSPGMSYLGGLPPLLFIASDGEVLRDEIMYTAHKAANPSRYEVHPMSRELYPPLQGIEKKYSPSKVHLQVYDDAAHVLPVLFPFTTPAKYCFRAIATFCKHVTGVDLALSCPPPASKSMPNMPSASRSASEQQANIVSSKASDGPESGAATPEIKSSLRRSLSAKMQQATHRLRDKRKSYLLTAVPEGVESEQAVKGRSETDVGGPRFRSVSSPLPRIESDRYAGEPAVYESSDDKPLWAGHMIRERISTRGVVHPLESETDLIACNMPGQVIGYLSELAIRRYLNHAAIFDRKFAQQAKTIEKRRHNNLKRAEKRASKSFQVLEHKMAGAGQDRTDAGITTTSTSATLNSRLAWALDAHEKPPPSSVVARRDVKEGQRLAEIADKSMIQGDRFFSANNLWSLVMNFFTETPERSTFTKEKPSQSDT